jgi:NAD(P)H-hydrate repair Nnr-like enzyme with NAD(P)H-hydrate epimerase domain
MERADRLTIASGTPGFALMMSAGQAVAEAAMELVEEGPIVVVAGPRQQWRRRFCRGGRTSPRAAARSRGPALRAGQSDRAMRRSRRAAGNTRCCRSIRRRSGKPALIIDALLGAGLNVR